LIRRALAAAAVLAAGAASAWADPVLHRVEHVLVKGRRVDVSIDVSVGAPGDVTLSGSVAGIPIRPVVRKLRPGAVKTLRLSVDPKKLRLRKLGRALDFHLTLVARETGGAATAPQTFDHVVLPPCIVLAGLGNEDDPGSLATFLSALASEPAVAGLYVATGTRPNLVAFEYPSRTQPLAAHAKALGKRAKKALRGTIFGKVDLVGYSYGGLVARSYIAQGGAARVRNCVFVATPNEGTPLAYIAVGLPKSTMLAGLRDNALIQDLLQQFADAASEETLRNMYPTYSWAVWKNPFTLVVEPAPASFLQLVFAEPTTTPLSALNAQAPPVGVAFDAFYYTSTPLAALGTVDVVNLTEIQAAVADPQSFDPATLASGEGDGVVPAHSVFMQETPAWRLRIKQHALSNPGTHATILDDAEVLAGIAAVLAR
jgi:pimeloyl-ACP methyl ester carboxylesterase